MKTDATPAIKSKNYFPSIRSAISRHCRARSRHERASDDAVSFRFLLAFFCFSTTMFGLGRRHCTATWGFLIPFQPSSEELVFSFFNYSGGEYEAPWRGPFKAVKAIDRCSL